MEQLYCLLNCVLNVFVHLSLDFLWWFVISMLCVHLLYKQSKLPAKRIKNAENQRTKSIFLVMAGIMCFYSEEILFVTSESVKIKYGF